MDSPNLITEAQADAIVRNLFKWLTERQKSIIACIVCDSVSDEITLQPLHNAYARITRKE